MATLTEGLPAGAQRIIAEEEALLGRVQASLERAIGEASKRAGGGDLTSREALIALREEASTASEDDLPPLLLEMSVRQRLLERPGAAPLPTMRTPYLAHLRLAEGATKKDYLLGHVSFLDPPAGVRVVDWRVAPVAQIFYRYREGDEFEEELPGRLAEGVVEARRIVVIVDGRLEQILGDGFVLTRGPDGAWQQGVGASLASGGAGAAARPGSLGVGVGAEGSARPAEVTALLDAEQFAAVCAPPEQPLIVLGTAGSGKTTVALHRLARIAGRDPEHYPLDRLRVVVPEEGLARLSRRLLEPLGVGAAQVATLDAWARALARDVFGKASELCMDPPALVSSLKRHPALYDALRARFAKVPAKWTTLRRLRNRLADAFTDRAFLGEVVAAARGDLSRAAVEETVRHTVLQLGETLDETLASIVVPEMKVAVDGRPIAEGTPDELAGTIDVEDLPILLFLRAWRGELEAPSIPHLVLDEAEDLSLFELFVLGRLLGEPSAAPVTASTDGVRRGGRRGHETTGEPGGRGRRAWEPPRGAPDGAAPFETPRGSHPLPQRTHAPGAPDSRGLGRTGFADSSRQVVSARRSVTLAGDEAQQTQSSFAGWARVLAELGVGEAATCRLAVSYRCPRPIAELARGVLGLLAPDEPTRTAREGAPVGLFHFPDEGQAWLFLSGAVRDLCEREPRASIAIVARDADAARRVHSALRELPDVRLVLGGDFTFEPGVDVTDVDGVKGLEFDYVIVPDASAEAYPATDEARRRLHVAVTRAAHQLWIVAAGRPTPLVAGLAA
jgi:hypothetical protein